MIKSVNQLVASKVFHHCIVAVIVLAGVVAVKAIYANLAAGAGVNLADLMTPPLLVPATQTVTALLEGSSKRAATLRSSPTKRAGSLEW